MSSAPRLDEAVWSPQARSVWAKTDADNQTWLPLVQHLLDAAAVAGELFDELPKTIMKAITDNFPSGEAEARCFMTFVAAAHDSGKACEDFAFKAQLTHPGMGWLCDAMRREGFPIRSVITHPMPHGQLGAAHVKDWLKRTYAAGLRRPRGVDAIASVIGGHHGVNPTSADTQLAMRRLDAEATRHDGDGAIWGTTRDEILAEVARVTGADRYLGEWVTKRFNDSTLVLVQALTIEADWIASSEDLFPYDFNTPTSSRIRRAMKRFDLPRAWRPLECDDDIDTLFSARFPSLRGFTPRPVQRAVLGAVQDVHEAPLIFIEADMGNGKTEAADLGGEVLARRFGCGGTFFGLPTMATSNPMFVRQKNWLEQVPCETGESTITLAHSKAALNDTYAQLMPWARGIRSVEQDDEGKQADVAVHSWFLGRKRSILANHVIGTIDQALFVVLKAKHVVLRHLGLAGKVVIIDEVHAADTYMRVYLARLLEWLGAYRTPVILMSATLPPTQREELIRAYLRGRGIKQIDIEQPPTTTYPLVTVVESGPPRFITVDRDGDLRRVAVQRMDDDDTTLVAKLDEVLTGGGCVGVIRNTVKRAQHTYEILRRIYGDEVVLVHSQFLAPHRAAREEQLVRELGRSTGCRPRRRIVVGTQVLEQSLDIDFDLLITDLAPVDLVLQRIGRLHRHERTRPEPLREPVCLVTGVDDWATTPPSFDGGSEYIYGRAALLRATIALFEDGDVSIVLPTDIPVLVEKAYREGLQAPSSWGAALSEADQVQRRKDERAQSRAEDYLLRSPGENSKLDGLIEAAASDPAANEARGRAAVRDTEDSLEVIGLVLGEDGQARLPEGTGENAGRVIPSIITETDEQLAKDAARCTVNLPRVFSGPWVVDKVIEELEDSPVDISGWQRSHWLGGQLVLFLDVDGNAELNGRRLHYDQAQGLIIVNELPDKEGESD